MERKYYLIHREKIIAKAKAYYQKHKKEKNEYDRLYRVKHKKHLEERRSAYYQENREKKLAWQREYNILNREKISLRKKAYYNTPLGKKIQKERDAKYYQLNKEKISITKSTYNKKNRKKIALYRKKRLPLLRLWKREKYHNDPLYRLSQNVRCMMHRAIKTQSTQKILGCSFKKLKSYIEKKFTDKMSWDNYGIKGWHIDHIKPLSWFDLSNPKEVAKANHYTNLQPLWAFDNLSKKDRFEG
jgi:hypothetical protein